MNSRQLREVGLSLGSNLGNRRGHLTRALRRLDGAIIEEMRVSSLWETEPFDVPAPQPAYLNLCVVGESSLSPEELLARCRELEKEAGREAKGRREARVLDLDLLWHGETRRSEEELELPHPRLQERRFVLAPLAEIKPGWRHPVSRRSVTELLAGIDEDQRVQVLEGGDRWWRHD